MSATLHSCQLWCIYMHMVASAEMGEINNFYLFGYLFVITFLPVPLEIRF